MVTSQHEERDGRAVERSRGAWSTKSADAFVRVLSFGTYERGYPRNAQVISCLRARRGRGAPSGTSRSGTGGAQAGAPGRCDAARLALAEREARLSRAAARATSTRVLVGYPGPRSTSRRRGARPAARRSSSTRSSRSRTRSSTTAARFAPGSLAGTRAARASTAARFARADLVVADTRANARYLAGLAGLEPDRVARLPRRRRGAPLPARLGAARAVHVPLRRQADPAARAGDDPRRRAARARDPRSASSARASSSALARATAGRTSSTCPGSSTSELPEELHRAGCALGVFGTSGKARA